MCFRVEESMKLQKSAKVKNASRCCVMPFLVSGNTVVSQPHYAIPFKLVSRFDVVLRVYESRSEYIVCDRMGTFLWYRRAHSVLVALWCNRCDVEEV